MHVSIFSYLVIITTFIFQAGCQKSPGQGVVNVDVNKVKELIIEDDLLLLDVRTPREFEDGHLKGAILVDFLSEDFSDKISELDKKKPVLVYCAVGGRSTKAADQLRKKGFEVVYNYVGGFKDWKGRGERIEK